MKVPRPLLPPKIFFQDEPSLSSEGNPCAIINPCTSFFPLLSVRLDFTEMTVLGAAIAAGLAANVWKDTSQLPRATADIYEPQILPDGMYM